jgi:putative glycosyltransferase (TIGR04348 family)
MTAFIVTPAPKGTRGGNRVTALRWAWRLRELGWRTRIAIGWNGEPCDLLIALHAKKSHASIARHASERPNAPRIVALTGTDVYGDLVADAEASASLALATRLVLLQPLGAARLPAWVLRKTRTIRQSARAPRSALSIEPPGTIVACAIGHLRSVKDPLLAANAVSLLPEATRVRVLHVGDALDPGLSERAIAASATSNGRWRWLGGRSRAETLRILAGSQVLVSTSVAEGGANVVTEAIACGVPTLATRIDGSVGILGEDYPGYFDVGDAAGLAGLLRRAESDDGFLATLKRECAALLPLVDPGVEREAWRNLLGELFPA